MSLIEKAARRLEELQNSRAGQELAAKADRRSPRAPFLRHQAAAETGLRLALDKRPVPSDGGPFLVQTAEQHSRTVEINLAQLGAAGYVVPDSPRSAAADEFRIIKRPVLANALGKAGAAIRRGNLVMITSSLPGEGKTFTSINLALSMAMEMDSTVLLVDADVSRPSVLNRLGLPASPGLLDVLAGSQPELAEVLLKTNVQRLALLPAGTQHARATELLASEAMNRLLDELATRYGDRIVIFDAPPILVSTESRALAAQVGQVVVVVEADRTSQAAVHQTLAMLESCPVVMTVLNKTHRSEAGEYYGQYRQYGE